MRSAFSLEPMTELTCVFKKNEVEAGSRKNIISALKILMTLRTES